MPESISEDPRRPLDATDLRDRLTREGWGWPMPSVVAATGSTNADLAAAAQTGAAQGTVVVAELQTAGRGRLARTWEAPARAGLTFSVLLRPVSNDPTAWGWLPLLTGVAVASALRAASGVPVALKWPNDVVVDGADRSGGPGPRKLGGILAERVEAGSDTAPGEAAVVVGVGLDIDQASGELPVPTATSLTLEGASAPDRMALLVAILLELRSTYERWQAAGGEAGRSGLREAYRTECLTIGRRVRVERAGADPLVGTAVDVDARGRLLVAPDERPAGSSAGGSLAGGPPIAVAAGDVVHLRGAD